MTKTYALPISTHPRAAAIAAICGTPARVLLNKMVERAEQDTAYLPILSKWLVNGGKTLALREAIKPFGSYWNNLDYANTVDALDSASAHAL